ncbi:MAG: hypothetical protein K0R02_702 [Rickettsiaceae bacterium]|jgi:hypothetical protein|nr:hypothetical protein [Rickettsiaceae bacterium]
MTIKELLEKVKLLMTPKKKVQGDDISNLNPENIAKQQLIRVGLLAIILLAILYIISRLINNGQYVAKGEDIKDKLKNKIQKVEIQTAGSSVKPQELWTSKLEDAINDEKKNRETKEKELLDTIKAQTEQVKKAKDEEIRKLTEQLNLISSGLEELKKKPAQHEEQKTHGSKINLSMISPQSIRSRPKDLENYLPASTFIPGKLLGGISVSTSVNTSEEPVHVIIRLTDYASLPQEVKQNYKDCRVLGSCYGDISSERAIVRLETLACTDKKNNQAVETKISGFIYGPDGLNGIKGKVVSMDSKHLKNAAIGGFLSGMSKGLKEETTPGFSIFGSPSRKRGWQDKFEDAGTAGMGSAAEKLANYHIKRAEMISPVVQIPAGVKIDIVLSKGVFVGSEDVKDRIAEDRAALKQ